MRKRRNDFFDSTFESSFAERIEELERPNEWTIINSMNFVLRASQGCMLREEFWKACREPLDFLNRELGLTDMQLVVLAIMLEEGTSMSWKDIAESLDITRLSLMTYTEEIEEMVKKGWLMRYAARNIGGKYQGFKVVNGVLTALRHNQCFQPPKLDNLKLQEFMDILDSHLACSMKDNDIRFEDDMEWMKNLVEKNPKLSICKAIDKIKNDYEKAFFMLCLADYAQYADDPNEGIKFEDIDYILPPEHETGNLRKNLRNGKGIIFKNSWIEHKCEDGIANQNCYCLTGKVKEGMLQGYVPSRSRCREKKTTDRMLHSYTQIIEKPMFYNEAEGINIHRLSSLLSEEKYQGVIERLAERGMRKGFATIFYGSPGTGKTESVLQIARQTGRDIMRVEIAGLRDKYVGESEKNIKGVFQRYKELYKNCEKAPILFFNEADAIFGTRMEKPEHSVDKMNNSMQNIILQEMEEFEGILIATTNLTGCLDPAFERRFLFKVEFKKPEKEVKAKIWKSMLGDYLNDQEVNELASKFDLTGGSIENIARKHAIDYILEGETPDFHKIEDYCRTELYDIKKRVKVGFN